MLWPCLRGSYDRWASGPGYAIPVRVRVSHYGVCDRFVGRMLDILAARSGSHHSLAGPFDSSV